MALDRETVGLMFKLDTDSKAAKEEMEAFKGFVAGLIEGIEAEFREQSKQMESHYRRRAEAAEGSNKRIKASNGVLKESIESVSSEIIESFGVDGDVANMLATQMINLKSKTVLASIGIVGAVAAIGAGFVAAANHAAELGDQIDELSKQTGLGADTLSGLGAAAKLEGKSLGDLSGTLSGFSQKLIDAKAGNNELQAAFRALGVDIKGTADQALRQAVSRLAEFKDGAEKSALAAKVGIKDLLPVLSDMEGGIDGAIKKAKELGFYFDEEGARAAANYKDQLNLLSVQFESLAVSLGQTAIPALSSLLSVIRELVKDTRNLFSLKFQGSAFEAFLKDIPNLMSGLPGVNLMARFAKGAAEGAAPDGKLPGGSTPPVMPKKQGAKRDEASIEALRRLQIQLAEEERLYKEQAAALRRTFEQREIDEADFVQKQIAALKARLATETAILERERAVVERSRFSKEDKLTKLEEIGTKEKDLARQTADEIEKINDDSRRRLEQQGIQLAEAQVRATEAMLSRKAALIRQAAEQEQISLREAEAQLGEIYRQSAEERLALANAELTRAGENTRAREIATERIKALEIEIAMITEQTAARVEAARMRDVESLIRKADELRRIREDQLINEGFSETDAVAITAMETLLNRPLTAMETLRTAFRATVEDLKSQVPSVIAVFTQMRDAIAGSLSAIIGAFVSGKSSLRQAAAEMFKAALAPLKEYLMKKARAQFALGLAELAMLNFGGAAKHFLAGAALSAAAGLIDVGASAIAGSGATAGATAPGGVGGRNEDRGTRIIEQGDRQRPGPQIVIIRAETEPGVIVKRVVDDYRSNGPTRNVLRADMLGASA